MNYTAWRWAGFILAITGAVLLTGGNVQYQWVGWAISCVSCSIWIYMGWHDRDMPRALMEVFYLLLAIRGVINWIGV